MATPMISRPFGFKSRYSSIKWGISSMQDGQVVAQNVTSTGLPRNCSKVSVRPSKVFPTSGGASRKPAGMNQTAAAARMTARTTPAIRVSVLSFTDGSPASRDFRRKTGMSF
jgi:hypothetical protein